MTVIFTVCREPDCPAPAEILDAFALDSTSGPVEHQKTRCSSGHYYLGPVEDR